MKNKNAISLSALFLFLSPVALLAQTAQDYQDLGNAVYQKGLYAKAVNYYQQAVQANPNDWQSYEDMGDAYMKMNDNSDALTAYQKSLQINPNNSAVQTQVNSLQSSGTTPAQAQGNSTAEPAPANGGQWEESQPTTIVVQRRHPWRRPEVMVDYKDGLAPMDHSKFWAKAELSYDYALQTDLINSANSINNGNLNVANTGIVGATSYTGSALASNSGLGWGGELGFLVNPYFGIGLGARYIQTNDYTADVQYNTGDSEHLDLSPAVIPLTLDLYLFMPDHDGRFFISAGAGYYQGIVSVDQKTTSNNFFSTPTNTSTVGPEWTGNLYGGNVGFQVGIGREFAVERRFGIEIYARGYYAKLTNFQGTLYDGNGNSQSFGLAATNSGPTVVDADYSQFVSGSERYATVDFTGFDIGASLNFYSF